MRGHLVGDESRCYVRNRDPTAESGFIDNTNEGPSLMRFYQKILLKILIIIIIMIVISLTLKTVTHHENIVLSKLLEVFRDKFQSIMDFLVHAAPQSQKN